MSIPRHLKEVATRASEGIAPGISYPGLEKPERNTFFFIFDVSQTEYLTTMQSVRHFFY